MAKSIVDYSNSKLNYPTSMVALEPSKLYSGLEDYGFYQDQQAPVVETRVIDGALVNAKKLNRIIGETVQNLNKRTMYKSSRSGNIV